MLNNSTLSRIIAFVAALAFFFYIFLSKLNAPDIALTILLLVGIWIGDTFLKIAFSSENLTALADLSLACLVLSFDKLVKSSLRYFPQNPIPETIVVSVNISYEEMKASIILFGVTFLLAMLWLVNLKLCSQAIDQELDNPVSYSGFWAYTISFLSVFVVVILKWNLLL